MTTSRAVRIAVPLLGLAALLWVGARPLGPVPPLGGFLDPERGVWALGRRPDTGESIGGAIGGLAARVDVRIDRRGVPHVFASTEEDAYRALGWLHARDRLFQIELQTRAAAGTLTELVGEPALPLDREARRIGLAWGAERKFAALDTTAPSYRALRAYGEGVNAYVARMDSRDVPLEYRLLHRRPMRWEPKHAVYLLARMGYTLAYGSDELTRERVAALVGDAAAAAVMPEHAPIQEPIVPVAGRAAPRFDFRSIAPPGVPDARAAVRARAVALARAAFFPAAIQRRDLGDALGSNNWAVAPSRTAHGYALLAGDPHLEVTLPSIWYEAHLVVPGRLDVYGVTIPGAPMVVIGFNRDVAWTFTNTGADVLDYYREQVDDAAHPARYMVDGAWRPLEHRVERYAAPDGHALRTDTLYFTHRGPMARDSAGRWISMRWTLYEPSDESAALLGAAHARTVAAWQTSMLGYTVPAQNMLVADRAGTISIVSTGRFPVRAAGVSGDTLLDGSRSAADWTGFRPPAEMPRSTNPAQGFLASANQEPTDPATGAPSLGSDWFSPWRAMRIDRLLRANAHVTPDDMRRYQTDPGSERADAFVPLFLAAASRRHGDAKLDSAASWLARWDRRYTRDNTGAILFERAMSMLAADSWDELAPRADGPRVFTPQDMLLLELASDSGNAWWDRRATAGVEHRDDVLAAALSDAFVRVRRDLGPPGPAWRWDRVHAVNIASLLRIPALGRSNVRVGGGPSTLSPSSMSGGGFASSWRMVVELGPQIQAWSTYPGGQSANPASPHYADRVQQWADGKLDPIYSPRSLAEVGPEHAEARITLTPVARR